MSRAIPIPRRRALRLCAFAFLLSILPGLAARGHAAPPPLYDENGKPIFRNVRGVNYLPSTYASPYDFWKNFDKDKVLVELARAKRIGFNSVRFFLSYTAYEEGPSKFLTQFADMIEVCRELGLTAMPVLFDSWGVEYDPQYQLDFLTKQDDPRDQRREPLKFSYTRFTQAAPNYGIDLKAYQTRLKFMAETLMPERRIPVSKDPSVIFWLDWMPSPGHTRVGPRYWERGQDYALAVVEPFANDPIVLAWDIMNEPDTIKIFSPATDPMETYRFAKEMMGAVRILKPMQPLTVGASAGYAGARVFAMKCDVIALHCFGPSARSATAEIGAARRHDKPVIVNALGAGLFPAAEADLAPARQKEIFMQLVPEMERQEVGFYLWHLMEGKTITPWAGLLGPDGSLKPAAEWLEDRWGGQ